MKSNYVELKTKPGRIARTAPDGPFIPDDEFVPVLLTPYVKRLIDVHEDVVVKQETKTPTPPEPTKAPNKEKAKEA